MLKKITNHLPFMSSIGFFFAIIGLIILAAALSFALFSLGYWLVTLILMTFFNFFLPFSWWYSLGAWLLWIILSSLLIPRQIFHSDISQ